MELWRWARGFVKFPKQWSSVCVSESLRPLVPSNRLSARASASEETAIAALFPAVWNPKLEWAVVARKQEGVEVDTHVLGIMNSEILAVEVSQVDRVKR